MLLGYVKRQSSKAPPLDSKTEACFFIAAIVLIRLLFLLNLLTEWNNVVAAAADETGYFETAFDMLHGVSPVRGDSRSEPGCSTCRSC